MTTKQTKAVDWSLPIEAVHEDGRVVRVFVDYFDSETWKVSPALEDGFELFYPDGSNWSEGPWRIRNVRSPISKGLDSTDTLPKVPRKLGGPTNAGIGMP